MLFRTVHDITDFYEDLINPRKQHYVKILFLKVDIWQSLKSEKYVGGYVWKFENVIENITYLPY